MAVREVSIDSGSEAYLAFIRQEMEERLDPSDDPLAILIAMEDAEADDD